jgi:hypothetical protein
MTMKRILIAIALACAAVSSFGATLNPVQLLNPAGSSSGQAIISTGASTAPTWGNVPVANVTGGAALTGATFTGPLLQSYASPTFVVNDTSGSGFASMALESSGTLVWQLVKQASQNFVLQRWVAGSNVDNPISVSNSTGAVTMVDGITNTPVSATTLSASGLATLSGGIAGNTTGTAASAGTLGQIISSNVPQGSAVSLGSGVQTNITSINLTAGYWLIWGNFVTSPAGSTTTTNIYTGVSTTSATLPTFPNGGAAAGSAASIAAGQSVTLPIGMQIVNIATPTTYFLVATVSFAVSTMSGYGFLGAVRIH